MTEKRKRAEIYRKAAEIVEENKCVGCWALQVASDGPYGGGRKILEPFRKLFQPPVAMMPPEGGWWGDVNVPENQEARILGLLFMAEIAQR